MNFTIRPARPEDAAAIARVHIESWKTTYRGIIPDAYIDSLDVEMGKRNWLNLITAAPDPGSSPTHVFVAEYGPESGFDSDPQLIGFLAGGPIREPIPGYDVELHAIYLLQTHQGRGAGRALVQALAHALHAQGGQSMIVWVLAQNPAVRFYQRLGAIQVAEKNINIGGADLHDLALGWPTLTPLL